MQLPRRTGIAGITCALTFTANRERALLARKARTRDRARALDRLSAEEALTGPSRGSKGGASSGLPTAAMGRHWNDRFLRPPLMLALADVGENGANRHAGRGRNLKAHAQGAHGARSGSADMILPHAAKRPGPVPHARSEAHPVTDRVRHALTPASAVFT